MSDISENKDWVKVPKVRFLGQPLGLGLVLAVPGGVMTVLMVLALSLQDPWYITVGTFFLIAGFFWMFFQGMRHLLMPFEKLWVCDDELQLRLGSIVLRRIEADKVRSIVPESRTVLVKNKDADLYRLKIWPEGKDREAKVLWVDWSLKTEEILREAFRDRITLLF